MPVGYAAGWFVARLLRGRSAAQVERGFWIVVLTLISLGAWTVTALTLVALASAP
jgi:hypothetical protein